MNKRWEYNKDTNKHELYFTQFYEEELIVDLELQDDNWYQYYFINSYSPEIEEFNSLEEAKEYVEEKYIRIINDQIDYLKDRIDKFEMKKEENNHQVDVIIELEKAKNMTEEELNNNPMYKALKGFNDVFDAIRSSKGE